MASNDTLTDKLLKMSVKTKTGEKKKVVLDSSYKKLNKKKNDVSEKAETFPCPDCGTKVLKKTGYCVKCKKKVIPKQKVEEQRNNEMDTVINNDVVENAETFPCPDCGTKVLKKTGYCVKCKKKVIPKQNAGNVKSMFKFKKRIKVDSE